MAAVTYFKKEVAAEQSTTSTSLTEVSAFTISWSDLTTAGFAAGDNVAIVWNYAAGGNSTTNKTEHEIGRGTTFAGMTTWLAGELEAMNSSVLVGGVHCGWLEQHTLVVNENFYYGQLMQTSGDARTNSFSCLVIKLDDLATDDWRFSTVANALAVTTTFQDDASVTLPSGGGDDWLLLGCGDWSCADERVGVKQRLNGSDGIGALMSSQREPEDIAENIPLMTIATTASTPASAVIALQGAEESTDANVLTKSRVFALRLGAFESFQHTTSSGSVAMSGSINTFVQSATMDLVLATTGPVCTFGQTIIDQAEHSGGGMDPYLQIQAGGTDIVTDMGLGSDEIRDPSDVVGVSTCVVGADMTAATITIDMDVATAAYASTAFQIVEWCLASFSFELAGGGSTILVVYDETEAITEAVVITQTIGIVDDNTEAITEAVVVTRNLVVADTDTESITETAIPTRSMVRVDDDVEEITEDVVVARNLVAVDDDVEEITETVVIDLTVGGGPQNLLIVDDDEESITETAIPVSALVRVVTETVNIGEAVKADPPFGSSDVALWLGQSNMVGLGVWTQLAAPATPAQLARLRFWHLDFRQFADNVGQLTPLSFDSSLEGPPSSSYDWFANAIPKWFYLNYGFGPEVYGGMAVADFLGLDPIMVKLARGASYLKARTEGRPDVGGSGQWLQLEACKSWDVTLPRSIPNYTAVTTGSGTATGVSAINMTDAGAAWDIDEHQGNWVTMSGQEAFITSNTATVLSVLVWTWGGLVSPPASGAYTIEVRRLIEVSLAKHLMEGYCPAAQSAAGGGTSSFNIRWINISLGTSDSILRSDYLKVKQNMLSLIWYVRNQAVTGGLTARDAHELGVSLALVVEATGLWPNAPIVNKAYREMEDADPNLRLVHVDDLELGGNLESQEDQIHFNAQGQKDFGIRYGQTMVDLATPSTAARKSHRHYGEHQLLTPIWGVGSGNPSRLAQRSDLQSVADDEKHYPGFYVYTDQGAGRIPIYMGSSGVSLSNRSGEATLIGHASEKQLAGMVRADQFLPHSIAGQRRLQPALLNRGEVAGYVWPMAGGHFQAFPDEVVTVASANQSHDVYQGTVVNRIVSTITGVTGSPDWLLRGHVGGLGISGQLRIRENASDDVTQLWMEHVIGHGDYTEAQVDGVGFTKTAPLVSRSASPQKLVSRMIALEHNVDSAAPTSLEAREVDHGGDVVEGSAVIWPNVQITQEVEPNWRGIEGCFRVVYEWLATFGIGWTRDTVAPEIAVWGVNAVDTQTIYDPATDTEYDQAWGSVSNQFYDVTGTTKTTYDKTGASLGSSSSQLLFGSGMVIWSDSGSGLAYGMYSPRPRFGADRRRATHLRLGQHREPAAAAAPAFASPYDQRNWAQLQQRSENGAGNADTPMFEANIPLRVAAFICVGTMAQVKAAAQALYALDVDATWTE